MASKHTIDITARIANLDKIRKELSNLTVNVKLESKELDKLQKLAKQGLTIDIKFKMPSEFKKLLDLQSKGINVGISGRGGASAASKTSQQKLNESEVARLNQAFASAEKDRRASVDRQLKQLFAQQAQQAKQAAALNGGFSPLVGGFKPGSFSRVNYAQAAKQAAQQQAFQNQFNQALKNNFQQANSPFFQQPGAQAAPFSRINPNQQIRQQNFINQQRRLQQKALEALEKANEYVRENPLEALLGQDVRGAAAKKFGVNRGAITARPNFFRPGRILEKDNFKDILFTSLLGGPVQGAGAALGVSTFGSGGSLIGANVAAAAAAVFERIADSLKNAVQAGAEYERSVTGITGILQATSQVVDRGGNAVPIGQQLQFQGARAGAIQDASQRALLPLGIGGATSSALIQSITAGLAQRGISPNADTVSLLAKRLGAAIQTLQPELASDPNLIRRGVEDIVGGGSQASRTELGSALRGIAPQLFSGSIRTEEDIKKATLSLEDLVDAIKNSDKATVEYQRALGSLQLAQQELGRGILEGIAPGLKALNDELAKADTTNALKELGTAIGELGSAVVKNVTPLIRSASQGGASATGTAAGLISATGKLVGGDVRGALSETGAAFTGINQPTDQITTVAQLIFNKRRREAGLPEIDFSKDVNEQLTQIPKIETLLNSAKSSFGIENPGIQAETGAAGLPGFKLFGLGQLRRQLIDRRKDQSAGDFQRNLLGINEQEIPLLRAQQERKVFDSSDFGQLRKAVSERDNLQQITGKQEQILEQRRRILEIEIGNNSKDEVVAKAREGVSAAEQELTRLRQEAVDKEREILNKRVALLQRQASAQDQGTAQGRLASLGFQKQANTAEIQGYDKQITAAQKVISNPLSTPAEVSAARDAIRDAEINKTGAQSRDAERGRQLQREQFRLSTSGLRNNLRTGAFADSQRQIGLQEKSLAIETKELPLEFRELARATREAAKSLTEFKESARLRELGAEGDRIAAAEEIVAAGGAVPAGISEALVKGAAGFDPEQRAAFERRVAEEKFNVLNTQQSTLSQDEKDQLGAREDRLTRLGLDKERLNLRPEQLEIEKRGLDRQRKQGALDEAEAALTELQNDPTNPQLQENYAAAQKRLQDIQNPGLVPALGGSQSSRAKKKGFFSINGEQVIPSLGSGMNISSLGGADLIASNDTRANYASAILGGLGGSREFAKVKQYEAGSANKAAEFLKGLSESGEKAPDKDVNNPSIFDKLEAALPKPLTGPELAAAFTQALNAQFS